MKILLMLPMMKHDCLWGGLKRGAGNNNFNYGLASIAAYLREHGHQTEILDPQFLEGPEAVKAHVRRGEYTVVGITSYTPTILDAFETARLCREAAPNATLVLGGPHATSFPAETLQQCAEIDLVVAREGEETMVEIVRHLEGCGKPLGEILGLTYRDDGGEVHTNPPRPFLDVNRLPMPAYDLFPLNKYVLQPTVYKRLPTVTTMVSRGCPFTCSFCHAFEVLGRKTRYRRVDLVLQELEYLMSEFGARGFMFHDSTFTLREGWVEEFCDEILRRSLDFTWMCLTRADRVTPRLLALMRRAGCFGVSFGVESANQKSLDLLHKGMTVQQNRDAIHGALGAGLYVTATYMLGLPGETKDDVLNTVHFAHQNATHIAHFFWPIPFPKTAFYDQCVQAGCIIDNPSWESFNNYASRPAYVNPLIGYEEMKRLQARAIRSYYASPKVILMNLMTINTWTDVKKYFRAGLAISGMVA